MNQHAPAGLSETEPDPVSRCGIRSESEPDPAKLIQIPAKPIRIRTWPGETDLNPNLAQRNRSKSEPWRGKTDPNPNSGKAIRTWGLSGDPRVAKLKTEDNFYVCPPPGYVEQSLKILEEAQVAVTVVVPNWMGKPWHLWLQERTIHMEVLEWSAFPAVWWC